MAPEIALRHIREADEGGSLTVLDPMCGSGTVLAAAVGKGHSAMGFDMDPLAVLMTQVATTKVLPEVTATEGALVVTAARRARRSWELWENEETRKFAEYWFADTQRLHLARLATSIAKVENADVRRVLHVAMSRIIITKSPMASLAADTSHSRPHRVATSSAYDVYHGFALSLRSLLKRLQGQDHRGRAATAIGDSRNLCAVADESIDLVITSPPYLNAIDYLRGHKLALIWMGYDIPTLRTIRSNSIGAERALDSRASDQAAKIVDLVESEAEFPDALPLSIITRYAHDISSFASELHRVVKPGAKVTTVVGNSTLRGNFIRNDAVTQIGLENAGFEVLERSERALPESHRYLPISTSGPSNGLTKRMRSEVVLTVKKA